MEQETKRVLFLIGEAGVESRFGCAGKAKARQGKGVDSVEWRGVEGRGDETPTELLLYVNIYFRQSYLAGDGTMGDWRPN